MTDLVWHLLLMARDDPSRLTVYLGWLFQAVTMAGVVVGIWVSLKSHKHIDQLTIKVDGRLTELLEATAKAADAKGQLIGRRRAEEDR